jgi:ketosteroid isomerase-like protein
MLRVFAVVIVPVAFLGAAIIPKTVLAQPAAQRDAAAEIRRVIGAQQLAWNHGDIDGFMDGYWRSHDTVFVSGDDVTRGWQTVRERYRSKYSDREKMGQLTFSDLEVHMFGYDGAVAFGRWQLERATDMPHGHFTLIFQKTHDGWKIVHDHTSTAEE